MSRRELEASLREGGEKVTQGRIRIDANRALQRLRDFRFADPAHWVLEVLRAAVLSGAKSVTVRTDADDVEVDFDGASFPADAMGSLLEQALNPGTTVDERRTRLLALGVAGALGVGARFVTVRSGGVSLHLTSQGVQQEEAPGRSTSLHLRKALGWRVASALVRGSPEHAAILERCERFPLALTLNGKRVQPKVAAKANHDSRAAQGQGWRLEAMVPWGDPLLRSVLELDVGGVRVASRDLELPGLQVVAWLRGDELRRNASGSDVVEDDPTFQEALEALRELSFELLARRVKSLEPDEKAWQRHFVEQLLATAPAPKVAGEVPVVTFGGKQLGRRSRAETQRLRDLLRVAKVLPGPADEWHSIAELEAAMKADGYLRVATERHPARSYPSPAVYLPPGSALRPLLPAGKHVDVAELVKRRQRIAERQRSVEAMPVESPVLPDSAWAARGPIVGKDLAGEVGFTRGGHGAFVRVLSFGKLLEAGEVASLAPLRLRAVVDVRRQLPDALLDPLHAAKLLGMVQQVVEDAAAAALLAALPAPEALPHARDLLSRWVLTKDMSLEELPAALRAAPLFACLEGPDVALDALADEPRWAFTPTRWGDGRLDGSRVLVPGDAELAILTRLGGRRLEDVSRQLEHEKEVRRRLAGPKLVPTLRDALVQVEVRGEGLSGLVGLPRETGARLSLTLLRDGFELETTAHTARYAHAVASVECAALAPNARWTGAVRDETFTRVAAAVAEAERQLGPALAARPELARAPGARPYLLGFLKKELTPFAPEALDTVTSAVARARLFETAHGPRSLAELAEATRGSAVLHWLPVGAQHGPVPEGVVVLLEPESTVTALADALGCRKEHAGPRLARLAAERRLEQLPAHAFSLPATCTLQAEVTLDDARALAGLRAGTEPSARVHVTVRERLVGIEVLPCSLPLEAVVECPTLLPTVDGALTPQHREVVSRALAEVCRAVARRAAASPDAADARRALLLALGRHLEVSLPKPEAEALCALPLFPCTDGQRRSVVELTRAGTPVRVVSSAETGTLPDRKPIVQLADEATKVAVRRWGTVEHVDPLLAAQNAALVARAAVPAVDEVTCRVASPWRRRVEAPTARGELVVSPAQAGRLELFFDKKPLVVLERALPGPFAAAVDAPMVTPKPGFEGVVEDEALAAVVATLTDAGLALAGEVARRPLDEGPADARVALAFWVAGLEAWRWRGQKKKRKGKGKKEPGAPAPHPLALLPLLRNTDGTSCTVADLVARGAVPFALEGGAFVEPGRSAWWPREGERAWAEALGLALDDVTAELRFAAELRARPRLEARVERPGRWRSPVTGPFLEGEVVLAERAEPPLVVEVLHLGVLVETVELERPLGGFARIHGAHLTPNERWTGVDRTRAFWNAIAAVDAALAQALQARLAVKDEGWQGWALRAAALHDAGESAVAAVVPSLVLFEDLRGAPVTAGAVLAQAARERRVQLAHPTVAPPADGPLVLRDLAATRALLKALDVEFEDVTAELRRKEDLQQALARRRLTSLTWKGPALVRLAVHAAPLAGELALAADGSEGITLARDGIPVGPMQETWPGVVGVLDVAELAVDGSWSTFSLTRAQRHAVQAEVERLYGEVAAAASKLSPDDRGEAAARALAWLGELGVEAPAHLQRLQGAARALAAAPLFETVQGECVGLLAVAAEVLARGRVAVTATRALAPAAGDQLVLHALSLDDAWLDALEARFGKTRLWRVKDLAEWRQGTVEADPVDGSPEAVGLRLVRREVRLLRAGALGHLTPDDLEDVKLHRADGSVAIRYDRKRKLALLDPGHPLIARTLREAKQRPERAWVLLAALFGHVNRELQHVTDEHEAQLLLALAGHLAANPKLLGSPE